MITKFGISTLFLPLEVKLVDQFAAVLNWNQILLQVENVLFKAF